MNSSKQESKKNKWSKLEQNLELPFKVQQHFSLSSTYSHMDMKQKHDGKKTGSVMKNIRIKIWLMKTIKK